MEGVKWTLGVQIWVEEAEREWKTFHVSSNVKLGIRGAKGTPLPKLCFVQLPFVLCVKCYFVVKSITLHYSELSLELILLLPFKLMKGNLKSEKRFLQERYYFHRRELDRQSRKKVTIQE